MHTSLKALAAATLFGLSFAATPAMAEDAPAPASDFTFSGYVQGVSDYRYRGYSLSNGDPAVQGSINLNHKSGFYVGAWASSIATTPVVGNMELDLYGGWTGKVTSGVTADVGLLRYVYPDGKVGHGEYFEPYASLSSTFGPVTGKVGVAYAWKQKALALVPPQTKDDNLYLYTEASAGIPGTPVSVNAHLGYTDGALSPKGPLFAGTDRNGFDYSVGASYNITKAVSISAAYVGVDRSVKFNGINDDTVVATLKLSM